MSTALYMHKLRKIIITYQGDREGSMKIINIKHIVGSLALNRK